MRKKIISIWSVLLVLVISLAVLVPGCDGGPCIGEIEVKATLCDAPWEGNVTYTLTGPGAIAAPITGTNVSALFDNVECGNWTCEYVSGGPDGAFLESITPSPTQEVTNGEIITFTLNFEEDQDASIEFITWTIDGVPIEEWEGMWGYQDGAYGVVMGEASHIIGVHYAQRVDGCQGKEVAVNETSEFKIAFMGGLGQYTDPLIHVANNWCAVVKEPEPIEKVSQKPSVNGEPVEYCTVVPLPLNPLGQNVTLDVETIWTLEKPIDYIKTIDWLHIGECEPQTPCCVLFELLVEVGSGSLIQFDMVSCAEVELMDDVDVNPENNHACSPPLSLLYQAGVL